VWLRRL
jgi:putative transposase